jgi:hypothetical protein
MNEKLQQAITASRTGQKREAQHLLTQLLKENPQEAQGWFLLSHLVDSEQKQVAYLSKTVALNPAHEKARQRLERLTAPVLGIPFSPPSAGKPTPEAADLTALPISSSELDFLEQEKGETVPDWMADDVIDQVGPVTAEAAPTIITPSPDVTVTDLPDWLQQGVDDTWAERQTAGEEPAPPMPEPTAESLAPDTTTKALVVTKPAKSAPTPAEQVVTLTRVMMALILLAAIVFILLVYMAIRLL